MGRRFTESEVLAMTRNRREDKALKEKLEKLSEERGYYHDNVVREKKKLVQVIRESRKTSGENPLPETQNGNDESEITLQQMRRFTKPWSITTSRSTFNVLYQRTSSPTNFNTKNRRPKSTMYSSRSSTVCESKTSSRNSSLRSKTAHGRNVTSGLKTERDINGKDAGNTNVTLNKERSSTETVSKDIPKGTDTALAQGTIDKVMNMNSDMHDSNEHELGVVRKIENIEGNDLKAYDCSDNTFVIDSNSSSASFRSNGERVNEENDISELEMKVGSENKESEGPVQNLKSENVRKRRKKRVSLQTIEKVSNQLLDVNDNLIQSQSIDESICIEINGNLENDNGIIHEGNSQNNKNGHEYFPDGSILPETDMNDTYKQKTSLNQNDNQENDQNVESSTNIGEENAIQNNTPSNEERAKSEKRIRPLTSVGELQRDFVSTEGGTENLLPLQASDRPRPHTVAGIDNSLYEFDDGTSDDGRNGEYTLYKGQKIRNYVKPQQRYKHDPFKMQRREKLMKKLATETPLFVEDQREKVLNVELTFSKATRKRMLQQLVEENTAKQHSSKFDMQNEKLDCKIQTFLKSVDIFCHRDGSR